MDSAISAAGEAAKDYVTAIDGYEEERYNIISIIDHMVERANLTYDTLNEFRRLLRDTFPNMAHLLYDLEKEAISNVHESKIKPLDPAIMGSIIDQLNDPKSTLEALKLSHAIDQVISADTKNIIDEA